MDPVVHQAPERQGMCPACISRCADWADYYQGDNWAELLKEVISFDSVEEFWGIYVSDPRKCVL
jgi:hypothetical protein